MAFPAAGLQLLEPGKGVNTMNAEQIRTTETPAADLTETLQKYKQVQSLLGFERRQVKRLTNQGKTAEAAAAQLRVDELTATAETLRVTLKGAHRRARKRPEERMIKADDANYIRA